ncbi:MAG: DUF4349 domain-containing protein [Firmicutes bacterium]|nr:DUF4349 domain-containing protein [Bacillota bacterium]
MECIKAKEYVQPYIDEALPASARREFELHMQNCPACATEVKQWQALSQSLRSLPLAQLPPGFSQALHEKLAAEPTPKQPSFVQRSWVKGLTAAALLILVFGAITLGSNIKRVNDYPIQGLPIVMNESTSPAATPASPPPPSELYTNYYMAGAIQLDRESNFYDSYDSYDYNKEAEILYERDVYIDTVTADSASALPEEAFEEGVWSTNTFGVISEAQIAKDVLEPQNAGQVERKIIRDANLSLRVDNFDTAYTRITDLAARYGGYVVSGDAFSYDGEKMQRGNIMLRVEASRLTEALTEIESLGKVESRNIYSQDITLEYYDVEGRLNQYQTQERRLMEILNKAETVDDQIKVERELTRIRTQLDKLNGQMRYYNQMTALSSINVNLYQPDASTQTVRLRGWVGLFGDIREGFISGINKLIGGVFAFTVGLARLLPLLVLIIIGLTVLALLIKHWLHKKQKS